MGTTKIEWTDKTWNPITGCTKISAGCQNCYAETMSRRLYAMGQIKYRNNFLLTLHENSLQEPLAWRKPHNVFVCSMSDLFNKDVPFEFIDKVLDVIRKTPQHNYQILTKRANIMNEYFSTREIPNNIWVGTTVECKEEKGRIDLIRNLKAHIKFLSCEPLLNDLGILNLQGIDWIIVGGESGVKARQMKEEWILSIQRQVKEQKKIFFFKQWGTWGNDGIKRNKHENGKLLNGKIYQQMPL
ncbi:MAG: phage Gp37/Gp68 family protein [Bacteroidales bacterium]|jgi:protein gp37|nr:phage Gp37/Gp68 family protein [Bacteroidales bacterium]